MSMGKQGMMSIDNQAMTVESRLGAIEENIKSIQSMLKQLLVQRQLTSKWIEQDNTIPHNCLINEVTREDILTKIKIFLA